MKESITRCPICNCITSISNGYKTAKIKSVHGITWDQFGYSIGGWGSRYIFMRPFSGEVCTDCFSTIKVKIYDLKKTIESLKNSSEDGICIYKTERATSDQVQHMQEDKLQQKRHSKSILRFLPFFS